MHNPQEDDTETLVPNMAPGIDTPTQQDVEKHNLKKGAAEFVLIHP